jgi:uncharacterized coiled-coil protein SlyX
MNNQNIERRLIDLNEKIKFLKNDLNYLNKEISEHFRDHSSEEKLKEKIDYLQETYKQAGQRFSWEEHKIEKLDKKYEKELFFHMVIIIT